MNDKNDIDDLYPAPYGPPEWLGCLFLFGLTFWLSVGVIAGLWLMTR